MRSVWRKFRAINVLSVSAEHVDLLQEYAEALVLAQDWDGAADALTAAAEALDERADLPGYAPRRAKVRSV